MTKKILYIEDNPVNMKLVESIMKDQSADMLKAFNGSDGIKIATSEKPDLILMDINMPGMNGYEALQILKADDATKNIPVIALTAFAMSGDSEKGLKAGFSEYITKPINIPIFIQTINKYI